ncbi:MAG: PorP/SprF family type IX secretion system membrane protein [Bacteroidia bacterium]|nr:PorP/SprF family type IX secretion system membrane protein [Bacteroidia bacterium]
MKNIIRIAGFVLLMVIIKTASAQQIPLNDLYNNYRYLYNPAYTGENDYMEAFLDARSQWTGLPGAPETSVFGLQKPYGDKVGLGVIFTKDKVQFLERLSGDVSYSYKLYFNKEKKHLITFGISAGFIENRINFTGVQADLTDPVLIANKYNGFALDANAGVKYNISDFELSFAFPQLLGNRIGYSRNGYGDFYYNFTNHFEGLASYKFKIAGYEYDQNNVKTLSTTRFTIIEPSVFYRSTFDAPWQLDLNLMAKNNKEQWLAITYRPNNAAFVVSAGLLVFDKISLGYAYEITNSKLSNTTNGTHEVMITYRFIKNKKKDETKVAEAKKEEANKEIMDLMNRNQAKLMSKEDSLKNEIKTITGTCCASRKELDDMLDRQKKLKNQVDSLQNVINGLKSGKTEYTPIQSEPTGNAGQNQDVDKLRKELEDMKQYVKEIKDKNVVTMKPVKTENGKTEYEEKDIERGCYVIVHSMKTLKQAERAIQITKRDKGLDANIIHNKDRHWYYIYTDKFDSLEPALIRMKEIRKSYYPESWVHIYKMSMGK